MKGANVASNAQKKGSTSSRVTAPMRASIGFAHSEQVLERAAKVIGDLDEAARWMGTPIRALDYQTPVSLLASEKGRLRVLTVLDRLEHGVL